MIIKINKNMKRIKKEKMIIFPEYFGKKAIDYKVAELLLNHVINNLDNPVITYGELASKISPDFNPQNLSEPLGNISDVCKENGLPLISGVVVNKDTGLPGEGFYTYFFNERSMGEWKDIYRKCLSDVKSCTRWQELHDAIC